MRINKKGQLEVPSIITNYLAIAALILIFLVIFFLIASVRGCTEKPVTSVNSAIVSDVNDINQQYLLTTFLRTPVDGGSVADLMSLSFTDVKYFDQLKKEVSSLLDNHYDYIILLKKDDTKLELLKNPYNVKDKRPSHIIIPYFDGATIEVIFNTVSVEEVK